ncbi:tetratricopeptide repeat protein [Streptomyces sp. NPDC057011]|uniref:tetratricopeptide repeat protein n=1 Tax=unclassified Streptomyces TaxID=2593676 RepID=UPI00362AD9D9
MSAAGTGDDAAAGSRQVVRAEGGFAYGVVGADIHVFGDGTPLYVLENWRPPPPTDPQWLREMPSRMLNARFAVVEFTGREDELGELDRWRDQGPRLGARWLHGPGGQGKTRLVAEFAARSQAAGWKTVTATHGPGSVLPPPGSQDLRLNGARGLLLVVDYADRWPLTHLTWLLSNAVLHLPGVRTRVLLLARTADTWPAVRAALANHQAGTSAQLLQPLPPEAHGPRARMFRAARAGFAARYDLPATATVVPPGPLDHPDFGLVLAVHIAALVAVDAHAAGRRPPPDMAGLTTYLLDREHLHWARLYGDSTHDLDPAGRTYRTPPHVMNRTVFSAVLTGALEPARGTAVIGSLDPHPRHHRHPPPERVLADHGLCYPPADPGRPTVLEPLYPDRLAEDFLALTLPGHEADYPAQGWAGATATALLSRGDGTRPAPPWTARAVTFLASAAHRWPHLGPRHLYPLLREDPGLAVEAGSAALTALAALEDIDGALLEAVEARFPFPERHVDLDPGIAAFTARLAEHWFSLSDDPAVHAAVSLRLGMRLINAGLFAEAAEEVGYSVAIHRRLAASRPVPHARELAIALYFLGAGLGMTGRAQEAVAATEEAVAILRRLVETDGSDGSEDSTASPESLLAATLTNLGTWLNGTGRRAESLKAYEEASAVRRRRGATGPYSDEEDAQFLHNHGNVLLDTGRTAESLAATERAVATRRRLAAENPAANLPDLADSLVNLGNSLAAVGRREEARAASEEAVALYRGLVDANPTAYRPGLANGLSGLAGDLAALERLEEAAVVGEEAVALRRRLAAADPGAHEARLAVSLSNLALWRARTGRAPEALGVASEGVRIHRRLCEAQPAAFESRLADSLNNLAVTLTGLDRRDEAVAVMQEAVVLTRRLAVREPAAYGQRHGRALHDLALLLTFGGRWAEAEPYAQQAVAVLRAPAEADPTAHEPALAKASTNLALCLGQLGRWPEALEAAAQPVAYHRRMRGAPPLGHEPLLALLLAGIGRHHADAGRWRDALEAAEEAVAVLRPLAAAHPGTHEPQLAAVLQDLDAYRARA